MQPITRNKLPPGFCEGEISITLSSSSVGSCWWWCWCAGVGVVAGAIAILRVKIMFRLLLWQLASVCTEDFCKDLCWRVGVSHSCISRACLLRRPTKSDQALTCIQVSVPGIELYRILSDSSSSNLHLSDFLLVPPKIVFFYWKYVWINSYLSKYFP